MAENDERERLLPVQSATRPGRPCRWGLVCLMAILYLQAAGTSGSNRKMHHDLQQVFRLGHIGKTVTFIFVGFMYTVPILTGFYADTIAGRYKTILLGLVFRVSGSALIFGTTFKCEASECGSDKDSVTYRVLVGLYVSGIILFLMGLLSSIIVLLTFGSQQIRASTDSFPTYARWYLWTILAGILTQEIGMKLQHLIPAFPRDKDRYYATVWNAVILGFDGVAVALLLLGKPCFVMTSAEQGQRSLKNILRIIRRHNPLGNSGHQLLPERLLESLTESRARWSLERLKIRKGVLAIALFSGLAVSQFFLYMLDQIWYISSIKKSWAPQWWILHSVKCVRLVVVVVGLPVLELVCWCCGRPLWKDSLTCHLKVLVIGSYLAAFAWVVGGVVLTILGQPDHHGTAYLWMMLPFILLGIAFLMIYCADTCLVFQEISGPGLETFVFSLLFCISLLTLPILAAIAAIDTHKFERFDVICLAAAAGGVVALSVVLVPVSIWFVKVTRVIQEEERQLVAEDNSSALTSSIH